MIFLFQLYISTITSNMTTRNEVIRKVMATYPRDKLTFEKTECGLLMMYIRGNKILIQDGVSWDMVKLKIENRMRKGGHDCGVCLEENVPSSISCQICANEVCVACHLISVIEHYGEGICPYCRVKCGEKRPKEDIKQCIISTIQMIHKEEYREIVLAKVNEYIVLKSHM